MPKLLTLQSGLIFITLVIGSPQLGATPELLLMQAINAIQASEVSRAENLLKTLITDEPEFKLGQMLYADLLKSRAHPLSQPGMGISTNDELAGLITELKARYSVRQDTNKDKGKIPSVLSRLDENYQHAIVVDLKQSRLFVFENRDGMPKQVADYFVSMGRGGVEKEKEGDLRTPLGVYFVQSYIPSDKLSDKYGAGAYPINYPNAWDTFNQRTGGGIWLHGTRSGTYNRPPLASEGCVVLSNDDLVDLGTYISLGQTPVLIGHELEWLSVKVWPQQRKEMISLFKRWIDDWQSLKVENYLGHYSTAFDNGKKDFRHWVSHKKRVARNKTFIKVEATEVSLLKHPNDDLMVATFRQSYQSDNYSGLSWKRQYWRKEKDGKWRIIFEGEIPRPVSQQLAAGSHR